MANLGKINNQYSQLGLDIIGFTKVTKNATDADVPPYLKNLKADFTVVKENGRAWNYYNCQGTPAIRLLYKGYLIFENGGYSSDRITTQILEGIVEAQSCGAFR